MSIIEKLKASFVTEAEIPKSFKFADIVNQRTYLSNGEMKTWSGDVHEVYSPVCVQTPEGLKRKLIGSYPVCTEKEAMESLDAAVKAYDNGRGEWPTMSVAKRIECVEKFTKQMLG